MVRSKEQPRAYPTVREEDPLRIELGDRIADVMRSEKRYPMPKRTIFERVKDMKAKATLLFIGRYY